MKPVDGGADDDQQWYAEASEKHAVEDEAESAVQACPPGVRCRCCCVGDHANPLASCPECVAGIHARCPYRPD